MKEAGVRLRRAEAEYRESLIQAMERRIEALEFEKRQQPGQSNFRLTSVDAGQGEDPEIVKEALRRFLQKREAQDNENWRSTKS